MTRPAEDLHRSYSLRVSSRYSCNPPGLYRPNGCLPCRFYRKNRRDRRLSPFPRPNWSARDTPTQRPALPPRGAPTAFSPPLSAPTGSTEIGSMPTSIISASKKLSPRFRLLVFISFLLHKNTDGFLKPITFAGHCITLPFQRKPTFVFLDFLWKSKRAMADGLRPALCLKSFCSVFRYYWLVTLFLRKYSVVPVSAAPDTNSSAIQSPVILLSPVSGDSGCGAGGVTGFLAL